MGSSFSPPNGPRNAHGKSGKSRKRGKKPRCFPRSVVRGQSHPGSLSAQKAPHCKSARLLCARPIYFDANTPLADERARLVGIRRLVGDAVQVVAATLMVETGPEIVGWRRHLGLAPH